jgi:UDP-glucose 4-epimerase
MTQPSPNIPQKILVTGVAGFLGSHLLDKLISSGHEVIGIDNLSMGKLDNIQHHLTSKSFQFLQKDITEKSSFENLPSDIDCIVHLAAFKIPRYGKAIDTLKINYQGTENVLDLAKQLNCKCVLASTSDVYGRNPEHHLVKKVTQLLVHQKLLVGVMQSLSYLTNI